MAYDIGVKVTVNKCDVCPKIVGKIAKVTGSVDDTVSLNFGRGRPQLNRPSTINVDDVSLVEEVSNGSV